MQKSISYLTYDFISKRTTIDPLAEKYHGFSPYAYALDNPLNYFDPDGREDWLAVFKAGWRIVSSVSAYGFGLATIGTGAASIPETAGLGTLVMLGGIGITSVAAYNLGAGINDLNIALITPDGMKAEVTKTLLGKFATELGGSESVEKAMNIVEGMILGNYKMGRNLIDGKAVEALIQSGEVSEQLMDFIKAKVEEDRSQQNEERKRKEKLKKKREEDDDDDDETTTIY